MSSTAPNIHTCCSWNQSSGETALIEASRHCEEEGTAVLDALLKAGADVNHQSDEGTTALMEASKTISRGYVDHIDLLLKAGADRALKDKTGRTALDYAQVTRFGTADPAKVERLAAGLLGGHDWLSWLHH